MKSTTKNMAFRIWFYFLILTGVMLLFLWMLQISFIEPYYERNRSQSIRENVSEIERMLELNDTNYVQTSMNRLMAEENMCSTVLEGDGSRLYYSDVSGTQCHLNSISEASFNEFTQMTKESLTNDFSIRFNSGLYDQGMYFYGRNVQSKGKEYYIFINAPVKLLDSTVYVLKRQFGLLALTVFSFATLVAFVLSRRLSDPISKITNSAKKLADGDLTVDFEGYDYSEVETLAKTLNYATNEFRKTDELRRDLVANVSHDIKTPLTMIKAYAEMIEDISGDNPEMRKEHLKVIVDEANHLERLVNDMLTLSRYEANVFDIKETHFNLYSHILSTIHLFPVADIDFKIQCDPELMVCADEIKMGQVLYNYINNAIKYVGDDNIIIVEAVDLKDNVIISVIDHGPGMPSIVLDHIWDRYYKIDKNYKRTLSSSGLGLSIVKAICEASGSKYWVTSEVGVGSIFYYTLKKSK